MSDITRTWPIGGTFSPAQEALYESVSRSSEAGEHPGACRPGVTLNYLHSAATDMLASELQNLGVLTRKVSGMELNELINQLFPHHLGHYLGLDTHDTMLIDRNVPLAPPGMGCVQEVPTSVGYRLTSEALSFGGQQCTATDVAIASGVAPGNICVSEECQAAVHCLSPSRVYVAMRSMRLMLEAAIDSMKVEKEDVPVLLVGGGSTLVDLSVPLRGASRVVVPEHHWSV